MTDKTPENSVIADKNQKMLEDMKEALNSLSVNNSNDDRNMRKLISYYLSGGYDQADDLHNVYRDYGYPCQITFFNFWNMYRRFGIAKKVVEIYPEYGWAEDPEIKSDSEELLSAINVLEKKFHFWRRLRGLDVRQRVGRYGGLFVRVRDGQDPSKPINRRLNGLSSLVDIMPLYESQLEVNSTYQDIMADNYGMPKMYQFNNSITAAQNPNNVSAFSINPDRVIIASEGSDNSSIYGISALEAPYNSLMDLRKIAGAGGEGFYKNAAQSIVFNLQDAASAKHNKEILDKFNEMYDDFSANRSRRAMWTPGMEAKTLESSLVSPKEYFMNSLYDVSAASGVEATLLIGQQTGRLASDQDNINFRSKVASRQNNFQTEMVTNVIDRFMQMGLLPIADYSVEWHDPLAPSSQDKLNNSEKMADINQKMFSSGQSIVFDQDEIREAAGYESEDQIIDEAMTEELIDGQED